MGIIVHCPNGHRVKVKEFLAGKKGVCPTCGVKFQIPSQIPQGGSIQGTRPVVSVLPVARLLEVDSLVLAGLPIAWGIGEDPPTVATEPASFSSRSSDAEEQKTSLPIDIDNRPENSKLEFDERTKKQFDSTSLVLNGGDGESNIFMSDDHSSLHFSGKGTEETILLPDALLSENPTVLSSAVPSTASPPAAAAPPRRVSQDPVPQIAPVDSVAVILDERPDLLWCMSVPGGEASEPLSADAIDAWIRHVDCPIDALVWRSDWPEWRSVQKVFPDLFAHRSQPMTSNSPVDWSSATIPTEDDVFTQEIMTGRSRRLAYPSGNQNSVGLVAFGLLMLVIAACVAAGWVLNEQGQLSGLWKMLEKKEVAPEDQ